MRPNLSGGSTAGWLDTPRFTAMISAKRHRFHAVYLTIVPIFALLGCGATRIGLNGLYLQANGLLILRHHTKRPSFPAGLRWCGGYFSWKGSRIRCNTREFSLWNTFFVTLAVTSG